MAIFEQESSMYYLSVSQNKSNLFTQHIFDIFYSQQAIQILLGEFSLVFLLPG